MRRGDVDALAHDRGGDTDAARAFFAHGPQAVRALRLRHGVRGTPVPRATIERLLAEEVRRAIGEFEPYDLPDPTRGLLGARASKTASVAAARRAGR